MYVEFARELDTRDWARRHAAGVAPDATPHGLHHLSDACARVRFRPATTHPTAARRARRLLGDSDVVPTLGGLRDRERANADVVLCMDEEAGIPAALRPCGPPVVSGVAWLEDPRALSPAHRGIARLALARMTGVFVECSDMTEPLVAGFGVPAAQVHFVRLGIDAEHFTPAPGRADHRWCSASATTGCAITPRWSKL